MQQIISLQKKLAPELIELLERRYNILRSIFFIQPIGRRVLAAKLRMGERPLRNDVDFLKEQGLLETDASGMRVTLEGEQVIKNLEDYIRALRGLVDLENNLAAALGISQAIIIPGNSSSDEVVKKEIGRAGARYLKEIIRDNMIIAVTGGTTIAEIAYGMAPSLLKDNLLVVPARGGLGEDVEYQANTIAAAIAKKLGGAYRMLHVPDNLDEEAVATLTRETNISEIIEKIRSADILVHGIGNAKDMALRRGLDQAEIDVLESQGAVGEAFGDYYNSAGKLICSTSSIGVHLDALASISRLVAVAGGSNKAKAIVAVVANRPQMVLITDEGAAKAIIEGSTEF